MNKFAATFVIAGTALLVAPAAHAGKYEDAIDGCKAAIAAQAGGGDVTARLGQARTLTGGRVQLDFKVKVETGSSAEKWKARCVATRGGEVLDLQVR